MSDPQEDRLRDKLEQLADVVRAILEDDFAVVECVDSRGLEFWGVLVGGDLVATLPDPITPGRPAGETIQ